MKEKLIDLETAKFAKEKDFNGECLYFYVLGIEDVAKFPQRYYYPHNFNDGENAAWDGKSEIISAPTQSLLQMWLRKIHHFHIDIGTTVLNHWRTGWLLYNIHYIDSNKEDYSFKEDNGYDTYEEALEAGLYKALELIENEPDQDKEN